ncbi:MAG: hypothetical protein II697_00700, partial [Clostridia bacterium]|nr:hypothetical protein [Clostridia bacterium]
TRIGTILRVIFIAFMLLCILISVVGNLTGIVPAKYWDLYLLTYLVPAALLAGLLVVALFKRLKTPFAKILTGIACGLVLMVAFSFASTYMALSPLLSVAGAGISNPSPEIRLPFKKDDYSVQLVLMRAYTIPKDYVLGDEVDSMTGEKQRLYALRRDAERFTAQGADGESCSVEGEIFIQSGAKYEIKLNWDDETTLRFYPQCEPASSASGEILVSFAPGAANENASKPGAEAKLIRSFTNAQGTHSASLYSENSYVVENVPVMSLSQDALGKMYVAYPSIAYQLLKTNTRVEGSIEVAPYGKLSEIYVEELSPRVLSVRPGDAAVGASGEITIYLDEKAQSAKNAQEEPDASATDAPGADQASENTSAQSEQ